MTISASRFLSAALSEMAQLDVLRSLPAGDAFTNATEGGTIRDALTDAIDLLLQLLQLPARSPSAAANRRGSSSAVMSASAIASWFTPVSSFSVTYVSANVTLCVWVRVRPFGSIISVLPKIVCCHASSLFAIRRSQFLTQLRSLTIFPCRFSTSSLLKHKWNSCQMSWFPFT